MKPDSAAAGYRWVYLMVFFVGALGIMNGCMPVKPDKPRQDVRPVVEEVAIRAGGPEKKDSTQEAYENFTMASVAIKAGRYEEGRKFLEKAISKDPDSAYLNAKMALLLKGLKAYDKALSHARRTVQLEPGDPNHLALLGDLHVLTGDDAAAIQAYKKILQKDPGKKRIRLLLTTILVRKKAFDAALNHLNVLIHHDSEMTIAWYYKGRINLEMGRFEAAEKCLDEALKRNPSLEPALFDKATLYQMTDRETKAARAYEHLLSIYPDNIPARERLVQVYTALGQKEAATRQVEEIRKHSTPGDPSRQALGLIYLRQGKLDESIAELDLIVTAWPKDAKSRYYLATAYEEKGENPEALEHFRQIPPDAIYYKNARMHVVHLLVIQEKYDEALTALKPLMAMDKDNPDLYLMLASIHEAREKYEDAMAAIEEGIQRNENNVNLRFRLGVILDKMDEKEACIREMRKVLEIEPENADAMNYIGYTYAEKGIKLGEALKLIQKALELKPDSGYIMDSLGWIYFQKGAYDKALKTLIKAGQLTGDDPTIHEHLGDAYFKKKDYEKALYHYEKALSLGPANESRVQEKADDLRRHLKKPN